jgi:elongation factor 3
MPAATSVPANTKASFDVSTLFVADQAPAQALASQAKNGGPDFINEIGFPAALKAALTEKKDVAKKEAAVAVISTLLEQGAGPAVEPTLIDVSEGGIFNILLELFADKAKTVQTASLTAVKTLAQTISPWSTSVILPSVLKQIETAGKWQVKTGSLVILDTLVKTAPEQMAKLMPDIVPVLAGAIWDTKADVKKAARATLTKTTALVTNKDIEKFIPALISALINPVEEVPSTIQLLSATTFVSEVDSPTLSLMVPLLSRGITERLTATKRKVAVITDNMAKLVDNEYTVRPFIPKLLPALIKVKETVADPEARGVVNRAITTLRSVGNVPESSDGSDLPPVPVAQQADCVKTILSMYEKVGVSAPAADSAAVQHAALLASKLITARNFDQTAWEAALVPYLGFASGAGDATKVAQEYVQKAASEVDVDTRVFDDEEEGEDLCNTTFSLAYGAKILLNTAQLRLKRGHRYGLCGRNGSGKSTLMNAIVNGQVEGFPSKDVVRTWYVAHDIDGSEAEIGIFDWVKSDERISSVRTPEEIKATLAEVGFNDERQSHSIGSLSGGWKMKLALARAILFKADILLLDEPTNHLDVINVTWLIDYLTSLTHCTCIIVSHDSDFLNRSVTDIIHLNRFKIKRYPGNLEDFVRMVPEAKSYYSLQAADEYKFKLPNPPLLDGVKTKEKSLLKMRKVGFQYPTQPVQQLWDITLQISLSSRVAVLGPNGSGKSTLVKILIGDMEPNKGGEVWKHPNLVVGYVAQHAFHHIDMHLDKTPLDYLLWRYQTGEDLEELHKASRVITEEEQQKMKEGGVVVIEGVKRLIDEVVSRKKLKQSYEYEVSFKGMSSSENMWLPRDELITRGFEKKVLELDTREAQRLGLLRPLVRKEIEKHFEDFGLEAEFTSHNTMRGLSGGQKVKVVLGAATWRRPHVIMLDEPTNYLDRESLAALIEALKDFEGGVLVITHNREFSESICSEVWAMRDGHLEASGHNWVEGQGTGERIDKKKDEDEDDQFDSMGNKIAKVAKVAKKSAAELRKAKKDRIARRKRGEEVFTDEEL